MQVHEQVYTSAARLLEGGGNLGVVAETRGFPRHVSTSLSSLRAYTMLPEYSVSDPSAHPPRLVFGPSGEQNLYALTSTRFAGADHTGRTTPLTHHLVVERDEAKRQSLRAVDLMRWAPSAFAASWVGEPAWIDPPRNVTPPPEQEPGAVNDVPDDLHAILPALADLVIRFNGAGRAAVLVVQPQAGHRLADWIAGIFALLPPSLQWPITCATHVVAVNDFVRNAALLVTYPDTPFLEQCRMRRDSRAPVIFDLTKGAEAPSFAMGSWGNMVAADASEGHRLTAERARLFDELHFSEQAVDRFAKVMQLVDELRAAPTQATGDDWQAFASRFEFAALHPELQARVDRTAGEAIEQLAADEYSASRWTTLSAVACDQRWPEATRHIALQRLLAGGDDAVDALLDAIERSSVASKSVAQLARPLVDRHPELVSNAIARAVRSGSTIDTRRAANLLQMIRMPADQIRAAANQVLSAERAVRHALMTPLLELGAKSIHTIDDLGPWTAWADNVDARRSVLMPILQGVLERISDSTWSGWLEQYAHAAAASDAVDQATNWICQTYGRQAGNTTSEITRWLQCLAPPHRQQAERIAEQLGFLTREAIQIRIDAPNSTTTPSTVRMNEREDVRPPTSKPFDPPMPESVGPLRLNKWLVLPLLSIGVGAGVVLWLRMTPLASDYAWHLRVMSIAALTAFACWAACEVVLRFAIRSPDQLGFARWTRWSVLILLLAAFFTLACAMYSPASAGLSHLKSLREQYNGGVRQ